MRGLVLTLAVAAFLGAAAAGFAAREGEEAWRSRVSDCVHDFRARNPGAFPAFCGEMPRAWDPTTLILAGVLGLGGLIGLIGAGLLTRRAG